MNNNDIFTRAVNRLKEIKKKSEFEFITLRLYVDLLAMMMTNKPHEKIMKKFDEAFDLVRNSLEASEELVKKQELDEGGYLYMAEYTKNMFNDLTLLKTSYLSVYNS